MVSDGYGVYQGWVQAPNLLGASHPQRTGLGGRDHPDLAACGAWAMAELQRLCHMATAPPTGGEWRAWYARVCKLIDQYHDRQDDAGRLVRRLLREMDSLGCFCPTTASSRPTTGRSGPCALGSSGASARWERPVPRESVGGAHLVPERDVSVAIGVDLSRPRGGRGPFLHGAAAPTRLVAVALTPSFKAVITPEVDAQEELHGCPHGDLPPRRIDPLRHVLWSRSQRRWGVSVPCCRRRLDRLLNCRIGTCGSHLVADADFEGSWERSWSISACKNQGGSSRLAERKLSHLRELERRLWQADVTISAIVAQVDQLPVERRARNQILTREPREDEWSDAMRHTPRQRHYAYALRGFWPCFPVSPAS